MPDIASTRYEPADRPPEIEIELNRGISREVNEKMSEMICIEGCGG